MDLVTEAEVTAGWPKFASLAADERAALITEASQAIEDYCQRSFDSGTVTEVYSGGNQGRLWLRRTPVISITSITVLDVVYTNSNGLDWQLQPEIGAVVRGSGLDDPRFATWFPRGTNNITVVYTWGYSEVPSPVKRACKIAIRQMAEATKVAGVYSSERIGDYQYALNPSQQSVLTDPVKQLLGPYVRVAVF